MVSATSKARVTGYSGGTKAPALRQPSRLREVVLAETEASEESIELDQPLSQSQLQVPSALPSQFHLPSQSYSDATQLPTDYDESEIGDEFQSFATAFERKGQGELFGDTGELAAYFSIGQSKLDKLAQSESAGDAYWIEQWELECRTWDLVQRLYLNRTKEETAFPVIHRYTSGQVLEEYYYHRDADAAETKIVLDWLRDGGKECEPLELRGNRWFYTKESIKSRKVRGVMQNSHVATEIDPDAPCRQGKRLEDADLEFERNFLRTLFSYVRSGAFEAAADVCAKTGNYWRAASLQGTVQYRNPTVDNVDGALEGNANRALWKQMCHALCREPEIDRYERALYGALCGDLPSVLSVCESWEDHLWAHYNAMIESRLDAYFASRSDADVTAATAAEVGVDIATTNVTAIVTAHGVLEGLSKSERADLRLASVEPFRIVQGRLITDSVDVWLQEIYGALREIAGTDMTTDIGGDAGGNKESKTQGNNGTLTKPHFLRFATHLILALRRAGVRLPAEASEGVLAAYVALLASAGQSRCVALYAAQLPARAATEALAHYLSTVEDGEQRVEQLRLAKQYGLSVRDLILRTVALICDTHPVADNQHVLLVKGTGGLTREEEAQIGAMEWTLMEESLGGERISLGNSLFRRFLLQGRVNAARALETRMPATTLLTNAALPLVNGREAEAQFRNAVEYMGHATLCLAMQKHEEWLSLLSLRPNFTRGTLNNDNDNDNKRDPMGLRQWRDDVAQSRASCIATFRELLEGGWCDVARLAVPQESDAYAEMGRLRQVYVPEIVLRLHAVYCDVEGRDVAGAMDLACLVAAEERRLYQTMGDRLAEYVDALGRTGVYLA